MLVAAAVGAVVVALDQLTKWWAIEALADGPIDLVGSLRFNLVYNTGTAFGLGPGGIGPLIAVIAVVVAGVLLASVRRMPSALGVGATGLVLGGAVGNVVDRAFRSDTGLLDGAVVDFVDLGWWPVFNVADSAIVVGAALYLVVSLRTPA